MKVKIYGEENEEKMLRLRLRTGSSNSVVLTVVDKDGNNIYRGHILRITSEGILQLYPEINKDSGTQYDENGYILCERM